MADPLCHVEVGGQYPHGTWGEARVPDAGENMSFTLRSVHVVQIPPDVDGLLEATYVLHQS